MSILQSLRKTATSERYLERVLELATEFMLEASVLSGVLGILESVIALRDWPTRRVVGYSLGFAVLFFVFACILLLGQMPKEETPLPSKDLLPKEGNEDD